MVDFGYIRNFRKVHQEKCEMRKNSPAKSAIKGLNATMQAIRGMGPILPIRTTEDEDRKAWALAMEEINHLPGFIKGEKCYPNTEVFKAVYVRPYWEETLIRFQIDCQCRSAEEKEHYNKAFKRTFNTAKEAAQYVTHLAEQINLQDRIKR